MEKGYGCGNAVEFGPGLIRDTIAVNTTTKPSCFKNAKFYERVLKLISLRPLEACFQSDFL